MRKRSLSCWEVATLSKKTEGWIKLSRKIQSNWVWEDKPFSKGQAWIDLILLANHQEGKVLFNGKPVEISKGEFLTSEIKLAERWGWGRTKLRNFLQTLKNEQMIEQRATNSLGTVITIRKYAVYQDRQTVAQTMHEQTKIGISEKTSKKRTADEQKTNSPGTAVNIPNYAVYEDGDSAPQTADEQETNNARTTDEQCANTNKKEKERKNDKEREESARDGAAHTLSEIKSKISELGLTVNAEKFFDHYEAVNWMGSNGKKINLVQKLKDWHNSEKKFIKRQTQPEGASYDLEKFDKLGYDIPEV